MSRDRARNSIRGRRAQVAGDSFESWLDGQHERARWLGILAHIDKIDPPAEVKDGRVEFGPKTVSDYVGMLDGGSARYVAVEAKSTLKEYLPLSKVSPKQQAHLDAVARGGGLALLVVEFRGPVPDDVRAALLASGMHPEHLVLRGLPRRYAVPWSDVPWQVLRTAKSVSELDLVRGGWAISSSSLDSCYLERFHPRGVPTTPVRKRQYARE